MNKLYIIIPAYNESETIGQVIEEWYPVVEHLGGADSSLIVIDDGSKDNTYDILKKYAETSPLLTVMTKENSGHGATVLYGYRYAIDQSADYIFQTDSDGQTLPDEFEAFWELRDLYDMIIGYRNKREDGLSRIFVTKILKLVIRVCFGVSVTDANTPFRLMKTSMLKRYIPLIPNDFNLSNVLLSVIYEKKNASVKYIPITFRPRQGGVNSINLKRIFRIGRQAIKDFKVINQRIEL